MFLFFKYLKVINYNFLVWYVINKKFIKNQLFQKSYFLVWKNLFSAKPSLKKSWRGTLILMAFQSNQWFVFEMLKVQYLDLIQKKEEIKRNLNIWDFDLSKKKNKALIRNSWGWEWTDQDWCTFAFGHVSSNIAPTDAIDAWINRIKIYMLGHIQPRFNESIPNIKLEIEVSANITPQN